jgi:hypothetical protein
MDMLMDRNQSSHIYDADIARAIFARLPSRYRELRDRFEHLRRGIEI